MGDRLPNYGEFLFGQMQCGLFSIALTHLRHVVFSLLWLPFVPMSIHALEADRFGFAQFPQAALQVERAGRVPADHSREIGRIALANGGLRLARDDRQRDQRLVHAHLGARLDPETVRHANFGAERAGSGRNIGPCYPPADWRDPLAEPRSEIGEFVCGNLDRSRRRGRGLGLLFWIGRSGSRGLNWGRGLR